ncbi:MAG: putative ABC transporter permease [Sporolactobacillus sp.]|jgi:uncharacterized membrane protein|nr:putative ABC transporter permease [Sporolactobacillus sp.]
MVYDQFFYFLIYAFLGWVAEVVFAFIRGKKLANRGFLYGPLCPIYGIGACLALSAASFFFSHFSFDHPHLIAFAIFFILCTALEWGTGWLLEQLFHDRWWDYSDKAFNLNGYVCLPFSLVWALAGVVLFDWVHPLVSEFVRQIPPTRGKSILFLVTLYLIADVACTMKKYPVSAGLIGRLQRPFKLGGGWVKVAAGKTLAHIDDTLLGPGRFNRLLFPVRYNISGAGLKKITAYLSAAHKIQFGGDRNWGPRTSLLLKRFQQAFSDLMAGRDGAPEKRTNHRTRQKSKKF